MLVTTSEEPLHESIPLHTPLLFFTTGGFGQRVPAANARVGDAAHPVFTVIL
jgi:hypothetical protein